MLITRSDKSLSSKWYIKSTDTGLTLIFHALSPIRYKRSVVSGLVHRIYRSCSTQANFDESLKKGKSILERNQYPSSFYEPIINNTLKKIFERNTDVIEQDAEEQEVEKK